MTIFKQINQQARVNIPSSRGHDQPFKRCKAHTCINRLSILSGGNRATMPKLKRDDTMMSRMVWMQGAIVLSHVLMRNTMKTKSLNVMLFNQTFRQCIASILG